LCRAARNCRLDVVHRGKIPSRHCAEKTRQADPIQFSNGHLELAKNHPFLDANKRTGWASAILFLRLNKIRLRVPPLIAVPAMVDLARGVVDEAEFSGLPRDHSP
jgi:death-on-curing protein